MSAFSFQSVFSGAKRYALAHKVVSAIVAIVVVLALWWLYSTLTSSKGATHYVLGQASKATVIASVSASGQVAAENQLDVKPQVSGTILWVGAKPGDTVAAGEALVKLDDTDAAAAVTSAERSLAAAKLQYVHDQAAAPIDFQNAQTTLTTAQTTLSTEYSNAYNTISTAYLDLPSAITNANNTIYGHNLNAASWNVDYLTNIFQGDDRIAVTGFATTAKSDYQSARTKYDAATLAYKSITRMSSTGTIDATLASTIDMATSVAQALQSELNFFGTVIDTAQTDGYTLPATVTSLQNTARSSLSTVNQDLTALLAEKKALDNDKQGIIADQQNVTLLSVGNTASGTNPISLQMSANSIRSQEENLASLRQTLAEYLITAPFSGTVASVSAQKYASASPGSAVATLITTQKLATLSLNEVDAAKIKLGDKATLTFDAIDGLSLTGSVVEIDSVGAVSQGVVSYTVKIGFDTQDTRIKSGMTVNAAIVTAVHQDVIAVPSSAVKTGGAGSYVQVLDAKGAPQNVPVTTGLSDNTSTEITAGVTEGESIIVRTVTATTKPTTSSAPSLIGGGGGGARRLGG